MTVTTKAGAEPGTGVMEVNYENLTMEVKVGDVLSVGTYLTTGSEATSAYLEVLSVSETEAACRCKNKATLFPPLLTVRLPSVPADLPTVSEDDKEVLARLARANVQIDFVSVSFTRSPSDMREMRSVLDSLGYGDTFVLAKLGSRLGISNATDIVQSADGVILSRGNLGQELTPEKVFLAQQYVSDLCNRVGKPLVMTRVLDSMVDHTSPTRAEATDVANAVLGGADAIMLGAETVRGVSPATAVGTVVAICAEAERVYSSYSYADEYFERPVVDEEDGESEREEPGSESNAAAAVRAAEKVQAPVIIVFTRSGRAGRLIAKYRPNITVMMVVVPRLTTDKVRWRFMGVVQARQGNLFRGVIPVLADPNKANVFASRSSDAGDSMLRSALEQARSRGLCSSGDTVVAMQRVSHTATVKILRA